MNFRSLALAIAIDAAILTTIAALYFIGLWVNRTFGPDVLFALCVGIPISCMAVSFTYAALEGKI